MLGKSQEQSISAIIANPSEKRFQVLTKYIV
jgi:hypothetical protein